MESLFELNDLHAFVRGQKNRQLWAPLYHVFINVAQTVKLLSFMAVLWSNQKFRFSKRYWHKTGQEPLFSLFYTISKN